MIATISKSYRFEAAHKLNAVHANHPCGRQHGHSYRVTAFARGEIQRTSGMVRDYAEIDKALEPLIRQLDHQDLNNIFSWSPGFSNEVETTAENLCAWLLDKTPVWIVGIRVAETEYSTAEVWRE